MGQLFCCTQISEPKVGIKEKRGKFDKVLEPGIHYVNWCTGKKVKKTVTLRLQQVDVKCQTKTKDNVFLVVVTSLQYRISPKMANQAFYKLTDPRVQIRSFVSDIITTSVPKMNAKDIYDKKDEISKAAQAYLQKELSSFGLEIVKTLIAEIFYDGSVNQSLNRTKSGTASKSLEYGDGIEVLNKLANSFDAILEQFKAKDRMQQQLLDIEERNAQLLERQVTLEKEQLQVAKESLTILAQVEKQKSETFVEALSALASAISGSNRDASTRGLNMVVK
ncbi:hypothetical protein GOP47_0021557 [Adiantum capillus-veneris]|uniref:Band 7 domain-containing protein n=1 Tax=Adiantum capillus-veneris TaxID=13818 RepID=A0A9D4Z6N5_ADICA|nr:hypothetical protein GOP47_0021557 [Adiantum capillus-veneris]